MTNNTNNLMLTQLLGAVNTNAMSGGVLVAVSVQAAPKQGGYFLMNMKP